MKTLYKVITQIRRVDTDGRFDSKSYSKNFTDNDLLKSREDAFSYLYDEYEYLRDVHVKGGEKFYVGEELDTVERPYSTFSIFIIFIVDGDKRLINIDADREFSDEDYKNHIFKIFSYPQPDPLDFDNGLEKEYEYYQKNKIDTSSLEQDVEYYDYELDKFFESRILKVPFDWDAYNREYTSELTVDDPGVSEWKAMIRQGEGQSIEFKSTLRFDIDKSEKNKAREHDVLKTINAFLNTNNGYLFIGINDAGNYIGLDNDLNTFTKTNKKDAFILHFNNVIINGLGKQFLGQRITLEIKMISRKDVSRVEVLKSRDPVVLKTKDGSKVIEEFYIRANASSSKLSLTETINYIRDNYS